MDQIKLDLMTVKEAADALSVSVGTVYRMIDAKQLRSVKPSPGTTRVRRADVEKILEGAT